jgi:hypothetical protein
MKVIEAENHNALPSVDADQAPALRKAYIEAAVSGLPLYIAPGKYRIETPVDWTYTAAADVLARDVSFIWHGDGSTVVTWGGTPDSRVRRKRLIGLDVEGCSTAGVGLHVQNAGHCYVEASAYNCGVGLQISGETLYNLYQTELGQCACLLRFAATCKSNCCNVSRWLPGSVFGIGRQTGATRNRMIQVDSGYLFDSAAGITFDGVGFECAVPCDLLQASTLWKWEWFGGCWFESPPEKMRIYAKRNVDSIIRGGRTQGLDLATLPTGIVVE